jgi:hypothetical protein
MLMRCDTQVTIWQELKFFQAREEEQGGGGGGRRGGRVSEGRYVGI